MANRFFALFFVGEYVHVWGIPAWGPWDDSALHFLDERSLDLGLKLAPADRELKINTHSELNAAVRESLEASTPRTVWVPERLMADVRALWGKPLTFPKKLGRRSSAKPSR